MDEQTQALAAARLIAAGIVHLTQLADRIPAKKPAYTTLAESAADVVARTTRLAHISMDDVLRGPQLP